MRMTAFPHSGFKGEKKKVIFKSLNITFLEKLRYRNFHDFYKALLLQNRQSKNGKTRKVNSRITKMDFIFNRLQDFGQF
ncbi:MAG: hypothetical protein Ct9H300mP23_08590 [Nitrospinota bacterium]|nr:MAG: hypothetical protein Ct9H300mP23_08590 [Nitrospinota bacterium]